MALLKYFNKATVLLNPDGPLSDRMPSGAISSANKEVKDLVVRESDVPDSQLTNGPVKRPRGQYLSFTEEEKARVAKRAAEFGVTNTLRYFNKEFADRPLKESTVRTWASNYKKRACEASQIGREFKNRKAQDEKERSSLFVGRRIG